MKDLLIASLTDAGLPLELFACQDGGEVLILPHGGRILGLFTAGSSRNFLWTNPALDTVKAARAFFSSEQWHNSGGDRTWLAPEIDFFFPDYPDLNHYWQPRQLDPGNYQLSKTGNGLCLTNRLTGRLARSKEQVELTITKTVSHAPNPLRHEHLTSTIGPQYAGYTLRTALEWTGDKTGSSAVGIWNLLQLPHDGELLIPTHGRTHPRAYFGTVSKSDMVIAEHLVRYRMRAEGEQKIGLRAAAVTGRPAYRHRIDDEQWELVIRNLFVNPSGDYVDIPWNGPAETGDALQACNVNSGLGQFSELEYHVPAIGPPTGRFFVEDVSQVWAYRGNREEIDAVTRALVTGSPCFLDGGRSD